MLFSGDAGRSNYAVLDFNYLLSTLCATTLLFVGASLCQLSSLIGWEGQNLITVLLAVIFVLVAISACFPELLCGKRIADVFSPPLMVVGFSTVYVLLPALYLAFFQNYTSSYIPGRQVTLVQLGILTGIIGLYFFGIGYHARRHANSSQAHVPSVLRTRIETGNIVIFAMGLIVLGVIFKSIHLYSIDNSLSGLIAQLSPSARREEGRDVSQAILLLGSMLDWGVLLLVFRYFIISLKSRTKMHAVVLIVLVIVCATVTYLTTSKRSFIFPFFILPLVWHHYLVRPIGYRAGLALIVGICAIAVGLLFLRIVAPLYLQSLTPGDFVGGDLSDVATFYLQTGEFSPFDMIMGAIHDREQLLKMTGGIVEGIIKYNFGTLVAIVPRVFWSTKPSYEDLSHVFSRWATGLDEPIGIAPTVFGAFWLFATFYGVAVGMFVIGIVFRMIFDRLIVRGRGPFDVFMYGIFFWLAFQYLRFGMLGFLLLLFIQTQLVGTVVGLIGMRAQWGLVARNWQERN